MFIDMIILKPDMQKYKEHKTNTYNTEYNNSRLH